MEDKMRKSVASAKRSAETKFLLALQLLVILPVVSKSYLCEAAPTGTNSTSEAAKLRATFCRESSCKNGGYCWPNPTNDTPPCLCPEPYSGSYCKTRINYCVTVPPICQNGGTCSNTESSPWYSCSCAPGFKGRQCKTNIDDCQTNNCKNGATCIDGENTFRCHCHEGYSGTDCSEDILDCTPWKCQNFGMCLERSNPNNYEKPSLPPPFNGLFSYALAAGFVCLCNRGTYGKTCEINPNDCLIPGTNQSVCVHALSCTDGLASFTCHCLPGYEGQNCSQEIDECRALPQPCPSGATCIDRLADFECANCPAGLGGRKCSVNLTGCNSNWCQNGATCKPILVQELPTPVHDYQCICESGWAGGYCNTTTLASFSGNNSFRALLSSKTAIRTGDWTFELSLRTSLTQFDLIRLSSHWGVIRIGAHNSSLMLLFFDASSAVIGQAAWPISDSLASADWVTLSVSLTNGSATLTRSVSGVRQPQTQLVDGLSDTFKRGQMSIDVGGERGLAIDSGGFRACVRDLRLVTNDSTFVAMETTMESGNATWGVCSRSVQCGSPSPCEAKTSSMCSDLWNDFVCHCAAGFGGRDCSVELPSFSFGVGGKVSSASVSSAPGVSSVYGEGSWSIEFRIVTLSRGAFLMLLGDPSDSATTTRLLITIDTSGFLVAQLLHSNGSELAALTSSNSVATGSFVSVKISVSISRRELSLAVSSAVRSASLSSVSPLSQLSGQLIIGGFSGASAAPAPSLLNSGRRKRSSASLSSGVNLVMPSNTTAFRGIIAAPRLKENFPVILGPVDSGLIDSLPGAFVASESAGVVTGTVAENVCENFSPCMNGATCANVFFFSFKCRCAIGWHGATCSEPDSEPGSNTGSNHGFEPDPPQLNTAMITGICISATVVISAFIGIFVIVNCARLGEKKRFDSFWETFDADGPTGVQVGHLRPDGVTTCPQEKFF